MKRRFAERSISLLCLVLAGCWSLKPAHYADLRKGKEVAGIAFADGGLDGHFTKLESLAMSGNLAGYERVNHRISLRGLEGDLEALEVYQVGRNTSAVVGILKSDGTPKSVDAEAARLGLQLKGTYGVTDSYGELVLTSDPKLMVALRNASDGRRELWAVVLLVERDAMFQKYIHFPSLFGVGALQAQLEASLAAGDLVSARTQLATLRELRSGNPAAAEARYAAAHPKVVAAQQQAVRTKFAGAGPTARLDLVAALDGLVNLLPLLDALVQNDMSPSGRVSPETAALVRMVTTEFGAAVAGRASARPQLAPMVEALKAVAGATDDAMAATEIALLPPLVEPARAEVGLLRSEAAAAQVAQVSRARANALEEEQAAAARRGHLATVAGVNLVLHAMAMGPTSKPATGEAAGPDAVSVAAALAAPSDEKAPAIAKARRALLTLGARLMPTFDNREAVIASAWPKFELAPFLKPFGECCGMRFDHSALKEAGSARISVEAGPLSELPEANVTTRTVSGTYSRPIVVSNREAVNAYIRKDNQLSQRLSDLDRQIRELRQQAQSSTHTTYTAGREKVLAPQGSGQVYQTRSSYGSTTTTTPGNSASAVEADNLEAEKNKIRAQMDATKRPPDYVPSTESAPWDHEEEIQGWTGTLKRHVTLRVAGQVVHYDQTVPLHEGFIRVKKDAAHNVEAVNHFTTREQLYAEMTAYANYALRSQFLEPTWKKAVEANAVAYLKAARGTAAEIELEGLWARYFMGDAPRDPRLDSYLAAMAGSQTQKDVAEAPAGVNAVDEKDRPGYRRVIATRIRVTGDKVRIPVGLAEGVRVGDGFRSSTGFTVTHVDLHSSDLLPEPCFKDDASFLRKRALAPPQTNPWYSESSAPILRDGDIANLRGRGIDAASSEEELGVGH